MGKLRQAAGGAVGSGSSERRCGAVRRPRASGCALPGRRCQPSAGGDNTQTVVSIRRPSRRAWRGRWDRTSGKQMSGDGALRRRSPLLARTDCAAKARLTKGCSCGAARCFVRGWESRLMVRRRRRCWLRSLKVAPLSHLLTPGRATLTALISSHPEHVLKLAF
eukprot:357104-Chlamydomonas_euryale.AAC.1